MLVRVHLSIEHLLKCTVEDWLVSVAWSLSRSFQRPDGSWALIPGADLMNHSPDAVNKYSAHDNQNFVVRASRDYLVEPGETPVQLTINYGSEGKSNVQLMLHYGMIQVGNSRDCIKLRIGPSHSTYVKRNGALTKRFLKLVATVSISFAHSLWFEVCTPGRRGSVTHNGHSSG